MALHKVVVATWEILDDAGLRRRRFFGDVVDVDEVEGARGVAAGALAEVDDAPADDQNDGTAGEAPAGEATADELEKPTNTAKVAAWRAYAVARGIVTADEAAQLTRDELRELVG